MNRKGVGLILASVLLVALALALAWAIYYQMQQDVLNLSPPVDCVAVEFNAEFVGVDGNYRLDVVNFGKIDVEGFFVKSVRDGELAIHEDIDYVVERGKTRSIDLVEEYEPGVYLVVPKVIAQDVGGEYYVAACKNMYGLELEIGQ